VLPVESGLFSLRPVALRAPRWFAALRTYLCHLPSLFHLGAVHGVFPCRVCSRCEPDTFRFALPFFLLLSASEHLTQLALGLTLPSPSPFAPGADLPCLGKRVPKARWH
jgi:hypothetical protein